MPSYILMVYSKPSQASKLKVSVKLNHGPILDV